MATVRCAFALGGKIDHARSVLAVMSAAARRASIERIFQAAHPIADLR